MERIITTTLVFILALFFLISCAKNNEENVENGNQPTNDNTSVSEESSAEENAPTISEVVSEDFNNEITQSERAPRQTPRPAVRTRSKTIKEHYYDGNYRYIVNQTFTRNQLQNLYYKAFAYYGLARGTKNNPGLKRRYIEESKKLLKRVGVYATNRELKARAILWYGLLKNVFPSKKLTNYEKISPFAYIKTRLANTRSYDDALFYSGLIYENVGYYKSAKINYSMLDQIADNNFVYHYARRKVYPAKTISSYYLRNIDRKLADLRRRNNQPSSQPIPESTAPTASPNVVESPEVGESSEEVINGGNEEEIINQEGDSAPESEVPETENLLNDLESQEAFYEEEDPSLLPDDPNIKADLQNSEDPLSEDNIYYQEEGESQEVDPVAEGEELDVSFDGFLKNLSQKKEKNNQEVFILDDNE